MDVWTKEGSVGRIVAPLRSRTERTQKTSRRADAEVVGAHWALEDVLRHFTGTGTVLVCHDCGRVRCPSVARMLYVTSVKWHYDEQSIHRQ